MIGSFRLTPDPTDVSTTQTVCGGRGVWRVSGTCGGVCVCVVSGPGEDTRLQWFADGHQPRYKKREKVVSRGREREKKERRWRMTWPNTSNWQIYSAPSHSASASKLCKKKKKKHRFLSVWGPGTPRGPWGCTLYTVLICSLLGPGLEIKIRIGILKSLIYKPLFLIYCFWNYLFVQQMGYNHSIIM